MNRMKTTNVGNNYSSNFLQLIHPFHIKSPFEIDNDDLADIKSLALKHNLLMLIYTQLQKYQRIISPEKFVSAFLTELKSIFLSSVTFTTRREVAGKEVVSLLRDTHIPAIIFRGSELSREIYSNPHCRNFVDIDMLIRREDAYQVDSILLGSGYVTNIPLKYWLYRIHHAVYYHPETKLLIEVHWNFGAPSFFPLNSEEIWSNVIFTDSGEDRLSPEMLMIMLLIHHHSHSFRVLKILVDIFWTLHKYENRINWHKFVKKLKKYGLLNVTLITLCQIRNIWGKTAATMESVQILQQELKKMSLRIPKFLISFFQLDLDRNYSSQLYKDKLLARFVLDKWSTILRTFTGTLFPVPEAINELYGEKRNWVLPFNYLRFISWRVKNWVQW